MRGFPVIATALDRKLLREVLRLKGQIATIAIVLASGISSFIGLRGTYASITAARDAYYDRTRFAHVFATLERAPDWLAERIGSLPGVALAEARISEEVVVPIEGMARPATARLLSLPPSGEPATNGVVLRTGRLPDPARDDEVLLLESFASAHGLVPGNRVPAVINGKLRKLRVVGVVLSPEFVYAIRPGAISDDPKRFGVIWMERATMAAAFRLEGAWNEISVRLQPGASELAIRAGIDRLLPYGGNGAFGRKDQPSNRIVTGEIAQLQALAGMVPSIFLLVAAFLINLVLGRLISLQRSEIAVLKAVGYTNREVGRHYLGLVAVVMVPGALLGALGGRALGHVVLGLYATVFRFPDLAFHMSAGLVGTAVSITLVAALGGALLAVRAATRLPPAEAMRPASPARYRRGVIERLGFGTLAGPEAMMVLREVMRRPLRTLLSALGIAGAIGLLILGRFGLDSFDSYLEGTLRREQRQDLAVSFVHPVSPRAVEELAHLPGVKVTEALRAVPVRIRFGHRSRESVMIGMQPQATLRRLVEHGGREAPIPTEGVLLTKTLAEVLGVGVGDRPTIELREGERRTVTPLVAGFVDESLGLQVYADARTLAALSGDQGAVSSLLLTVDPPARAAIEERLRRAPKVLDVSDLPADIDRMRDTQASVMNIWTVVSILLATAVIFGVVYNNARIALAMRNRDLASLRVLGYSRRQISWILIGGQALEVLAAIPLGLLFGRLWGNLFVQSVDRELFRWAVVVAPRTYVMATAVALLAAAASALWVRRSLDRLDLIGVLKTRE